MINLNKDTTYYFTGHITWERDIYNNHIMQIKKYDSRVCGKINGYYISDSMYIITWHPVSGIPNDLRYSIVDQIYLTPVEPLIDIKIDQ